MKEITGFHIAILRKLISRRKWGSNHVQIDTLLHMGWKPHEKGLVKKAVKELINMDLVLYVKKGKEAIVLNKNKLSEIINLQAVKEE